MEHKRPFADDMPYWKTDRGKSTPEAQFERAAVEIQRASGRVTGEGYVSEGGKSAYMIAFEMQGDQFRIVWPVLEPRRRSVPADLKAARMQAATMLYYDVKAACIKARVAGARVAFHAHLMLPDGRTASEATTPDIQQMFPSRLLSAPEPRRLVAEIVE